MVVRTVGIGEGTREGHRQCCLAVVVVVLLFKGRTRRGRRPRGWLHATTTTKGGRRVCWSSIRGFNERCDKGSGEPEPCVEGREGERERTVREERESERENRVRV